MGSLALDCLEDAVRLGISHRMDDYTVIICDV